jgi:hypothetical protein
MPRTCVMSLSRSFSSVCAGDVLVTRAMCVHVEGCVPGLYDVTVVRVSCALRERRRLWSSVVCAFESVFQRFTCHLLWSVHVSFAVHCVTCRLLCIVVA